MNLNFIFVFIGTDGWYNGWYNFPIQALELAKTLTNQNLFYYLYVRQLKARNNY